VKNVLKIVKNVKINKFVQIVLKGTILMKEFVKKPKTVFNYFLSVIIKEK